jgi:ATP-binding cassette subfamily B protein
MNASSQSRRRGAPPANEQGHEDPQRIALLLKGRHGVFALIAVLSFATGLVEAAFLVVVTKVAFAVTKGTQSVELFSAMRGSLAWATALAVGLVIARTALGVGTGVLSARMTHQVMADLRVELGDAWLSSPWSAQGEDRSGELQDLVITSAQRGAGLLGYLLSATSSGFNLGALLMLAAVVNPISAVLVIVAILVLGTVVRPFRGIIKREGRAAASKNVEYASALSEISDLAVEVRTFDIRPQLSDRLRGLASEQARIGSRVDSLRTLVPIVYTSLAYLAIVVGLAVVAAADGTSIESVGAVMLVMLRSLSYGQSLQTAITGYHANIAFLDLLEARRSRYDTTLEAPGSQPSPDPVGFEARSLRFSYRSGVDVLQGIDFSVQPGEMIGVVGPSGSGKSTLMHLLLGLRRPTGGRLCVSGVDLQEVSPSDWARTVAFVPQRPRLISGSVLDNVRFYRTDVSELSVRQACEMAKIDEEIDQLPSAYDTDLGDRGSTLSGGQQQRLCIARALAGHPRALIMDEPTSALDPVNESLVRDSLMSLRGRVTTVIVAHRLSTLDACDRIMVLDQGEIVMFGSQKELLDLGGYYQEALRASGLSDPADQSGAG